MNGGVVAMRRPQQLLVLAALAVDVGRMVPVEVLMTRVWGADPPEHARRAVHTHIARIRRLLEKEPGAASIARRSGGYILEADPEVVDVHRFRNLIVEAAGGHDDHRRADLLREALKLWRGVPLAGLSGEWSERMREALSQQRLDAMVGLARAEMSLGNPDAVLPDLRTLAIENPLDEHLAATLMQVLAATGRTVEALRWYTVTRQRLIDELGVDPSTELQQAHQVILRADDPTRAVRAAEVAHRRPAQLPADVPGFAGRDEHLAELDALLPQAGQPDAAYGTAVVICAIVGTAGIGKSALAVHWAHQVADRFPDGQLYVNLRGFDASGDVMDAATALRGFLDALDVPPRRIPTELDDQAALFRSLVSGRRMLILLDNARDSAQVRPLLPGSTGCLVLITSRNQLTSLIAATGAHTVALDLLTHAQAEALLAHRLGADRVAAEPEPVAEIITRCARLPLALATVAANAAVQPHARLRNLADDLHDAQPVWQALTGDDPSTNVSAVFSWSYRALSPDAARLFRLLGLHPGPDLTACAAASLSALTLTQVRQLLAELTQANLLAEHVPGRYLTHDLLHAYANHLVKAIDSDQDRQAALHRTLDHYLHTAHRAALLMAPHRHPLEIEEPLPGVVPEKLTGPEDSLTWFTVEHRVLMGAVRLAESERLDARTWQMAWSLNTYFLWRGHWHDWVTTERAALDAVLRLGDEVEAGVTHRNLARAYTWVGRYADAHRHLEQAASLSERNGDHTGLGYTMMSQFVVFEHQERYRDALTSAQRAEELLRRTDDRWGHARALNAVGWFHAKLGELRPALARCQEALTLVHEIGDQRGEAATWDSLGHISRRLGDYPAAIDYYTRAIRRFQEVGDRSYEADSLTQLGDTQFDAGDVNAARRTWQSAFAIFTELDQSKADLIRAKITNLDTAALSQMAMDLALGQPDDFLAPGSGGSGYDAAFGARARTGITDPPVDLD